MKAGTRLGSSAAIPVYTSYNRYGNFVSKSNNSNTYNDTYFLRLNGGAQNNSAEAMTYGVHTAWPNYRGGKGYGGHDEARQRVDGVVKRSGAARKGEAWRVPFGWQGEHVLRDLSLVHMGGRIYDPTTGRFISPDPFVQAPNNLQNYNRYSYVLNNPLSYTDPSGFFFKKVGKALKKVGNAIGGAIGSLWKTIRPYVGIVVSVVVTAVTLNPMLGGVVGGAAGAWANGGKLKDFVIGMGIGMVAGGIGGKLSGAISEKITWFARGLQQAALTGAVAGSLGGAMGAAVYGRDVWKGARNGAVMGGAAGSVGYLFRGVMGQGGQGGGSSRSGLGNALRNVPVLGGILGGVGDAVSGLGNIAIGNFGTGVSQIGVGIGRAAGHIWGLPNTAVGLTFGAIGLPFGASMHWDSEHAILQVTNHPFMGTAMSLGDVNVFGANTPPHTPGVIVRAVTAGHEEALHSMQSRILGPLYFPAHLLAGTFSMLTPDANSRYPGIYPWHRNNFMEFGPMTGRVF